MCWRFRHVSRALLVLPALGAALMLAHAGCSSTDTTCPDGVSPKVHESELIEVDTVWSADCGPHAVKNFVRVGEGVTLTIEAGARVELGPDAMFEVGKESFAKPGTLNARGTAERPITFARHESAPWAALYVQYPAKATLEHAVLEGGGANDPNSDSASLVVRGDYELPRKDMVTLAHVTIRDSGGPGLRVWESGALTAESTDLTITGCGKSADELRLKFPASVSPTALTNFPVGTYSGNAIDEIFIDPSSTTQGETNVLEDVTIHDRGVPYRVGDWSGAMFRFGTDEAHPEVTLTIEPGVTLRFPTADDTASGGLLVMTLETSSATSAIPRTILKAKGTADKPIVFTSASNTPKAGDWQGLWLGLGASADNVLDHVVIEYAGSELLAGGFACPFEHSNDGALAIMGGPAESAFLTNSIIRHGASAGVLRGWDLMQGAAVDFKPTNTFEDVAECEQTVMQLDQGDCPQRACG
jgi:hypothetical protein